MGRGTRLRDREVRYDSKMVAGPYALYRLLEDALTGRNIKRGTTLYAAYHYVVDPPTHLQRPFTAGRYERVARRESVTGLQGVGALSQASR